MSAVSVLVVVVVVVVCGSFGCGVEFSQLLLVDGGGGLGGVRRCSNRYANGGGITIDCNTFGGGSNVVPGTTMARRSATSCCE
jgi:hypothetical protein